MKKIIPLFIVALFAIFVIISCKKDCKKCKSVTTNNADHSVIQEGTSSEYCDTQLDDKQNEAAVTDSSTTTKWVCE